MTPSEKGQLTKDIKATKEYIADMQKEIDTQYPQPNGTIWLCGEIITVRRMNEAICEFNDMMFQRHGKGNYEPMRPLMFIKPKRKRI